MLHKEYKRICTDSDTVVLFIHGIVGTPNHFNEFISIVPDTVSVYNMLLDGHGKTACDFSKTSMKKWELQVTSVIKSLSSTHRKIYIVAHSLGTLLAIEQAVENKSVCGLFLLAVPLKLSLKIKLPINTLKVYFDNIRPDDLWAMAAKNSYGIEKDKNILHYIGWIPRFFELFAKVRKTRRLIKKINVNCAVYQSRKDEMVSRRSANYLKANPIISVNELENSGHYYYDKQDKKLLLCEFSKMFD